MPLISSASLTVLGAWVALFIAITGLGHVVRRLFGLSPAASGAWTDAFWLGYAVLIGFLQVWHLLLPIDWKAGIMLVLGSLIGLLGIVQSLLAFWRIRRAGGWLRLARFVLLLVIVAPVAAWIVIRALAGQVDFDSGFYHISTLRWLNEYPIVPGLGNLHYRLAFNQTFFLFVAQLNFYPEFNQGLHIANSLLFMVLAVQLSNQTLLAVRYPGKWTVYRLCNALLLPVVLYHAVPQRDSANLSSPSPDLSIFLLQIVVFLAFVRLLFCDDAEPSTPDQGDQSPRQARYDFFFVVLLSAVGISSKLSFGGFGVATAALAPLIWTLRQPRDQWATTARQATLLIVIVVVAIGIPWMVCGIVTSGYPAFPSSIGGLPVDYRIPAAITKEAEDWVYSFARQPRGDMYQVLSSWSWLESWLRAVQEPFSTYLVAVPALLAAGALVVGAFVLVVRWLIQRRIALDYRFWLPLHISVIAAAFWFFSAPDARFAGAALWLVALWATVMAIFSLRNLTRTVPLPPRVLLILALLVPIAASLYIVEYNYDRGVDLAAAVFLHLPVTPIEEFQTRSGLIINVSGDPNNSLLLWDAPLPASPYRLSRLEQRGPTLRDGFRLPPDASLIAP